LLSGGEGNNTSIIIKTASHYLNAVAIKDPTQTTKRSLFSAIVSINRSIDRSNQSINQSINEKPLTDGDQWSQDKK